MKKYSVSHRLLHWVIAFCITILFSTAFLIEFVIGRKKVVAALHSQNIEVTEQAGRAVARQLNGGVFDLHIYTGIALAVFFLLRIIYMLVKDVKFPNPFAKGTNLKEKIQGYTYILFYIFVAIEACTGLGMKYHLFSETMERTAKEIHEFGVYWVPVFVLLHFLGIYIAETTQKEKGIASKMIGGE